MSGRALLARGLGLAGPDAAPREDLAAITVRPGPRGAPEGCRVLSVGDYVMVLAPAFPDPAGVAGTGPARARALRAGVAQAALARQRLLEALMGVGPILPVAPGTPVPADTSAFVAANAPVLREGFRRLEGAVQYQVTLGWDAERAQARFCPSGPDRTAALRQVAADLADRAEAALAAQARDAIRLPVGDTGLLNLALLVDGEEVAPLETELERIDAIWPEGLRIRLLGPGPAVSFALLRLECVPARAVAAAARLLNVDPGMSREAPEVLRRAAQRRAARVRQSGGDAPSPREIDRAADLLEAARRTEAAGGRCAFARQAVTLARLHRDDESSAAAAGLAA